jgi:hypothetical protein
MKFIASTFVLINLVVCGWSQEVPSLFPFQEHGHWGFMDDKGTTVIPAVFAEVGTFSEGLASYRDGDKTGFIDRQGVKVVPAQFDDVGAFSEGVAAVRLETQWGYINNAGAFVISPQFQAAGEMHSGLARVATWSAFRCGLDGEELSLAAAANQPVRANFNFPDEVPFGYLACSPKDIKVGYINNKGSISIPFRYSLAGDFKAGLAKVTQTEGSDDVTSYINQKGTVVAGPFLQGTDFSEGLASVRVKDGWTYVDTQGRLWPCRYEFPNSFSEGLAAVFDAKTGKCGYIDNAGKQITPFKFDDCGSFGDGLALVTQENDTEFPDRFFINRAGAKAFGHQHIRWGAGFSDGLAILRDDTGAFYIDTTGKVIRQAQDN